MAINTNSMRMIRCAANATYSLTDHVIVGVLAVESTTLMGKAVEGDDFFASGTYASGTGEVMYPGQVIEGMWSEIKVGAGRAYAYVSKIA